MANPRKFSEKIALHNQKQAEETAAFEAIMRDVAQTTRVNPQKQAHPQVPQPPQQQQLMHIAPPQLGVYRGGSLPNVNQSIDLRGTLEEMKQMSGRESLMDRFHRQRQMQSPHRRPFPFDKRTDCSPYGAAYLQPPDTSWRRTSSDSALHTSSMGQPNAPGNTKRENSVPQENIHMYELQQGQSRPKSCEVPGINIYPSPEQGQSIPISNSTGSLPDLTNIHFPSPLATPLDAPGADESQYVNHHGNHHGNLSPTAPHQHIGAIRQSAASPSSRRRTMPGGGGGGSPQPLVIQGSPTQMRHSMSPQPQYHPYGSPVHSPHRHSPVHSPLPHRRPQPAHSPHRQSAQSNTLTVPNTLPPQLQNYIANHNSGPPSPNHLLSSMDSLSVNSDAILGTSPHSPMSGASIGHNGPVSPHLSNSQLQQPKIVISSETSSSSSMLDMNGGHCSDSSSRMCSNSKDPVDESKGSPLGYRSSQSDCPASPNSPVSPHSFSPAQSPGLPPSSGPPQTNAVSAPSYADNYYMHQQAQTNALQHQFEQFNMDNPDLSTTASMYSNMINQQQQYSQAPHSGTPNYMSPTGQQQNHFFKQTSNGSQHNSSGPGMQQPGSPHQSPHQPGSPQLPPGSPQSPCAQQMAPSPTQLSAQDQLYQNLSPPQTSPQPNNIPDIILTGADDLSKADFSKELGNAMAQVHEMFGDAELLPSDEALRDGLGDPLDFNELQMLTDPSLVTDPATEDSFRLDRL